jgi:hypothetical protein
VVVTTLQHGKTSAAAAQRRTAHQAADAGVILGGQQPAPVLEVMIETE